MSEKQAKLGRFGVFIFATALVALSLSGQQTTHTRTSLVTDWSSRHVVFSTPTTAAKLAEVSQDPRFHQQWVRRNMHPAPPTDGEATNGATESISTNEAEETAAVGSFGAPGTERGTGGGFSGLGSKGSLKGDWSTSLGPGASVGADEYPAKFSFDSTTASCANDFVVFGTGTAGAAAGASATATGTFSGVPTNGQTATLTFGSGAVDTVTATAATDASTTGTFTGAPTSGQTLVVHNGANSATFTAEDNTAATGTITVAAAFCVAPNQGVTINGTSLTTNATQGTGTVTISGNPTNFTSGTTQVVVGTVTYTFVNGTPATGSATAIQVHYSTANGAGTNEATAATNLAAAIAGNQANCVTNPCFSSAGVANPAVTATASTNVVSLTARCAGGITAPTLSDNSTSITSSGWTAGSNGTTTGTTFALSPSALTTPSPTTVADAIVADVNTNTATTAVSAANTAGVVTLTANTWGTVGNTTTLAQNATSGVTVSGATLSGGSNAAVTGNQFRIDNNNTDDAAALAAVLVTGGSTAGVTGSSAGAVVTITATTGGTAGNSITATETMTGFTVTSPFSGGADLNSSTGFFAVSDATGGAISPTTIAGNFATAVAAEAAATGVPVTASSSGAVATVTASAAAPGSLGNGVALTETLSNFAWNHATLQGGVGQASIVAYRNLYTSCGGTVPTTAWSYFTGGTIQTSPALSLDGTQVAFVQTTAGVANLVLLKFAAASSSAGSPVTLTTSTAAAYRACVAPCMLTLPFSGGRNDTNSSVFYDYTGDVIYVGDDNGSLHKFTSIFNGGTPAEFTTAPWPVALTSSTGRQTTSPVFAINNGIYVGTANTGFGTTGGHLYRVDPTTGAQTVSAQLALEPGIVDGPIVDPSAGEVYVFAGNDTSGSCIGGFAPCGAVFQLGTAFASAAAGTEERVGNGSFGNFLPIFAGDFDNTYFNSTDPPTGNLYVCGINAGNPALYRIHITANVMSAPVLGPTLTSGNTTCSPVTEAFGGTTDLIFVNVQDNGSPAACATGGCVMSFNVTGGTLASGTAPTAALAENGGTSGVIIDTLGAAAGGSNQVYFSPLGTGQVCPSAAGCGVQASQSGLN